MSFAQPATEDENNGIEDSRKASGGMNDGRLSNQD